jgi:hypothetical protein
MTVIIGILPDVFVEACKEAAEAAFPGLPDGLP